MTNNDQTHEAVAAMPAALAEILSEPGWQCESGCWWYFDYAADTETRVQMFACSEGLGAPVFHTDCFIIEPVVMYAATDLMRRIEAALAQDAADREEGASTHD